ncbi:hypothetical protein ACFYO0_09645 [Streptomyces sp. NPDC006365]|uniref:hypothetical protein n=1 Tax=Streptomyces sp. NPDC006365 TaxID=3364744 RepID=UPI0036D0B7D9
MSGHRAGRPPTAAVINATSASVEPARTALAEGYPEASVWSLLDDRLISDAEASGGLTPALSDRMLSLIAYAVHGGADAVLLSCSMYGPVLEQARREHRLPMLSSDEALFAEVARRRFGSVLLLGHLIPAVQDSVNRLTRMVILGMFSLSPARTGVEKSLGLPVLSAPLPAARALRERVAAGAWNRLSESESAPTEAS